MATNPLTDLIPARSRKYVYALAALAVLVYGAWEASNGDWRTFVGSLFAALVPTLAASNTHTRRSATIGSSARLVTGTIETNKVEFGRQVQEALDAYHAAGGRRHRA